MFEHDEYLNSDTKKGHCNYCDEPNPIIVLQPLLLLVYVFFGKKNKDHYSSKEAR